jgi:NADH-quinone oxidoreductase subunit M
MFSHGIISPRLFLIAGVIYNRAHHREIARFGGLAGVMPEYAAMTGLAFFASLGLPGMCGFISEFLVLTGSFPTLMLLTAISATGMILTAAYYLWAIHRAFPGKLNPLCQGYPDLVWRERVVLYPLGAIAIVLGFYPYAVLDVINPTLFNLIAAIK